MSNAYFTSPQQSHEHSLKTLEALYEYDDFMGSIGTMADMGCGAGLDLEWWATRVTRDERATPLNIRCTGIDIKSNLALTTRYRNLDHFIHDFEQPIKDLRNTYDVVWCHDAFQYVVDPFATLKSWHQAMSPDGMLAIVLPQTTNIDYNIQAFDQRDFCYHHWTLVNFMHVLAVSGFDCRGGFFLKDPADPWLHAIVYRSDVEPLDPRTTTWRDLIELGLVPDSAAASYDAHGYVRQRDLVLPWLDRALREYSQV